MAKIMAMKVRATVILEIAAKVKTLSQKPALDGN